MTIGGSDKQVEFAIAGTTLKMKKTTLLCLLTLLVSLCYAQKREGRPPQKEVKVLPGVNYTVQQYREAPDPRAGQLGIAQPKNSKGDLPIVICIHGGGWSKGDKDQMAWMAMRYARRGYIGVTLSYRLTGEAPMPACIQDVREAIRYIKEIATSIQGDPERIALLGYSAGAHLALLTALTPTDTTFKTKANAQHDASVACAVAIAAPADLMMMRNPKKKFKLIAKDESEKVAFLQKISPISHVHKEQVPIFMLHGDADKLVPAFNYVNFERQCTKFGVKNFKLHIDPGGGHMFFFKKGREMQSRVDRFLSDNL
ncbi:MAG: alpha/beta hydrolase [Verrucomicrobiota bacterium]|nr:alpha/beta hydrolase [Verrucomicrobiota bacterium]